MTTTPQPPQATPAKPFHLNTPIKQLLHELTEPGRQIKADLVGFGPLEEGGSTSFALVITGAKGQILAEAVVNFLQTLSFRAEQKKDDSRDVHPEPDTVQ